MDEIALERVGYGEHGSEHGQPEVSAARPKLLRSKKDGAYKLKSDCWGERYERVNDPEGVEIPAEFWLAKNFSKVPGEQWARVISIYYDLCDPDNKVADAVSEVSVVFARKAPDFKEWRTFVPKQTIGATHVNADLTKLVDIVTGEECEGFPDGWVHAGSSHSHNTMAAFFSGTDNKNEFDVPGIHIVVGHIDTGPSPTYMPLASIVLNHKRNIIDKYRDVIEILGKRIEPHAKVWGYIAKEPERIYVNSGYGFGQVTHGVDHTDKLDREIDEMIKRYYSDKSEEKIPPSKSPQRYQEKRKSRLEVPSTKCAIADAKQAAQELSLPVQRVVSNLCDAIDACKMDVHARNLLWELMSETLDSEFDREQWEDILKD